jgi:hypothetical protein
MLNTNTKSLFALPIVQSILVDLLALGFILLMPALSHTTGIPFYFIEPMRIMLVVALLFSSRGNAYAIAVMLPVFSFLISGHPAPVKMAVIVVELLLNVWLFLTLIKQTHKPFISMFSSILLSKLFCYLTYWVVFSRTFVIEESQTIFLLSQLVVALVLSAIVAAISAKRLPGSLKN